MSHKSLLLLTICMSGIFLDVFPFVAYYTHCSPVIATYGNALVNSVMCADVLISFKLIIEEKVVIFCFV
jgi:hypothetical protein